MPDFAKVKWICFALTTFGLIDFVGIWNEPSFQGRSKRSSCQSGKQILEVQRRNLHTSPPFTVKQFDSLVQTRMRHDGCVELVVPPQYQRPPVGSTLKKELSRGISDDTFLQKVEKRLALVSPSRATSVQLLCPRSILWRVLRWIACDDEFAGPWKDRLTKISTKKTWTVTGHWHKNNHLELDCLVLYSQSPEVGWARWEDYGSAFERLASPGREPNSSYHDIAKFSLGKLQTAVYSEIDATKDGARVELKTVAPRNKEAFETVRAVETCLNMMICGIEHLCIGVIDQDSGELVEVKELSVEEMSAVSAKAGVRPEVLLGRLASAMAQIREACSKYPSGSFDLLIDGESMYLNVS